ncbi:Twitching motility protein PilT [Mangrovibacter sp. MFB070]|uniref:type IV pilus twitching motility protein PilT n=1 Tax=Mangrovibacter sp. MFB070 TaxID=1224318 RepID=UPI0004D6232E|nr:type IV pilus twitching motility protein PilT [Mangrovibacter sp. MFB070]KEA54573.1 Twitching motility protein PilT [Mangrovibacter sp. MFB070]
MEEIVALSVKHNVSDLHLCSSGHFYWRKDGVMEPAPCALPNISALLDLWLTPEQHSQFKHHGQLDFAVGLVNGQRLRANAFLQVEGVSLALRILPQVCPELAALQVPEALMVLLQEQSGLVLVCGATGSGKSTTLAAMVGELNRQTQAHIITLEDPVEFVHKPPQGVIQQREVGLHCASFAAGLKGALRQDPDVILLGELRDSETIRLALTAAETGHLVLATLHTRGAAQAVERLVDVFPAEEKSMVRTQLAGSLKGVVAQQLAARKGGGRVALFELLVVTPAVSSLVREGKTHQLPGVLQTGKQAGMQTFEQSRAERDAAGILA